MIEKGRFMIIFIGICNLCLVSGERPSEDERVRLWREHNVWPPDWQEESEGYIRTHKLREGEINQLTGADERWENWMQHTQSQLVPKFTEKGFDIIDTPVAVHKKLLQAVEKGLLDFDSLGYEEAGNAIYGGLIPKFIENGNLAYQVLDELKGLHEAWAGGIELKGTSAYGVRLYQNGSSLVMHHDKVETHVISSIIHIAHKYESNSTPWPLHIEDHNGVMHEVSLQPGQMVFYESAKCLHGRMKALKGQYYGSLFLHYQPVDKSIWDFDNEQVIAAVPPHWREGILENEGSRWAGQAITVDSVAPQGAPHRVILGEHVHSIVSLHAEEL
mmetsp:Transcript_35025/g.33296  ORF Transcript_35025/g.33296 Transcript_35025/m.33296 type:complete len:330 (+) Transcript_35025:138-1127(+)